MALGLAEIPKQERVVVVGGRVGTDAQRLLVMAGRRVDDRIYEAEFITADEI